MVVVGISCQPGLNGFAESGVGIDYGVGDGECSLRSCRVLYVVVEAWV